MFSLETLAYFSAQEGSQQYPFPFSLFYPSTGTFVGFVADLGSQRLVHESVRLFRQHDAAGKQHVICMRDTDEAREHPGEAVFRGQAKLAVGGGEFRARHSEAQVREAGENKPHARGGQLIAAITGFVRPKW